MSKNHSFRPQLTEILEARTVPSMAGVTVATGIPNISVTLPQQISLTNPQVQAAFKAFDQSYIQAVDALLDATGPNGLVAPATAYATYLTSVEDSLDTFARQLVLSLNSSGATGSTSPANSTVANQVVSAIVGGSNSLQSELLGLSLAQLAVQVPLTTAISTAANQGLVPNVVTTAEQVRVPNRVPVAEEVGLAGSAVDLSSTSSLAPLATKAAADVRSAFNNFLNNYFQAVQSTLLAPGSATPQANRAAFDARVNQAIQSLETSLSTSLGRYPATSGLGPQIKSALEGTGPSSLKGQLANLASPVGAQSAVVREFTLGSTRAIAQALAAINADVARLIGPTGR